MRVCVFMHYLMSVAHELASCVFQYSKQDNTQSVYLAKKVNPKFRFQHFSWGTSFKARAELKGPACDLKYSQEIVLFQKLRDPREHSSSLFFLAKCVKLVS